MTALAARIRARDTTLFDAIAAQLYDDDKRSLLALHAAVAERCEPFAYLEIGSYRGGSLQVIVRDPRCASVISIDARTATTADVRGSYTYTENTTAAMVAALAALPGADVAKLTTIDAASAELQAPQLPCRPDFCFVDGEHTHDAVLRDARFCAEAMAGRGVLAFHDRRLVAPAIRAFLREAWADVACAMAFNGEVFAVELGGLGVLRTAPVRDAVGSRWHSATWELVNRAPSPLPLFAAVAAMPRADVAIAGARRILRRG